MLACSALSKRPSAECGGWWLDSVQLHTVFVWCVVCVHIPLCPARSFVCLRCGLRCLICVCDGRHACVSRCCSACIRRLGVWAWPGSLSGCAKSAASLLYGGRPTMQRLLVAEMASCGRAVIHGACWSSRMHCGALAVLLRSGACGHAVSCLVGTLCCVGVLVGCVVLCGCMSWLVSSGLVVTRGALPFCVVWFRV